MVNVNVRVVVVIAMAATTALILHRPEAAEYVVGDNLGWRIPPDGPPSYASWASEHDLVVDDILVFKFAEGEQDLAFLTKEDYIRCNTANPLHVFKHQTTIKFLSTDTYFVTSTVAGRPLHQRPKHEFSHSSILHQYHFNFYYSNSSKSQLCDSDLWDGFLAS